MNQDKKSIRDTYQNENFDNKITNEEKLDKENSKASSSGNGGKKIKGSTGKKAGLAIMLILPFLLFALATTFFSVFVFKEYIEESALWQFLVNTRAVAPGIETGEDDEVMSDGEVIGGSMMDFSAEPIDPSLISKEEPSENISAEEPSEEVSDDGPFGIADKQIYYNRNDFPRLTWGDYWAKLTIPSIGVTDVKIYVGESKEIFKRGVGKRFGTHFPGEGGHIVMSAHVTRAFYDLSELKVGDRIYIQTIYGNYIYQVTETFIFTNKEYSYVLDSDGKEYLTMYTCYPRGSAYRSQRFGVNCNKISGPEWVELN